MNIGQTSVFLLRQPDAPGRAVGVLWSHCQPTTREASTPMRVLLVEDNPELVSLLIKGLGQSGFSADSVGTVGDALHVLATMKYAAIVLDLGLPDEDGLTLLRDMSRTRRYDAGAGADGARRRQRPGHRPAGRRRRLSRQAFRDGGTGRAPAGAAAPSRQPARPAAHLRQRLARHRRPPGLRRRRRPRLPGARDGGAGDPAAAQRQRGAQAPVRGPAVRPVGRCRIERGRSLCPPAAQDARRRRAPA